MAVSLDLNSVCQTFRFYAYSARKSWMNYHFQYLPYRRNFCRPLATAHGVWQHREGIVIRLEREDGSFGFGEVAPVPLFGTETYETSLRWCSEIEKGHIQDPMEMLGEKMPCLNWAIRSAVDALQFKSGKGSFPVAALASDTDSISEKQAQGFHTFKLKIGAADLQTDLKRVGAAIAQMKEGQRLRLDANAALSERGYKAWLEYLEGQPIEYLEQPLGVGLENRMLEIAGPFSTPIALDESIAGLDSLLHWKDWPGTLVVKPSLLGWIGDEALPDLVGSSVFETAFGFEAALQFLARRQKTNTAIGFDTNALLEADGWSIHESGPMLKAGTVTNAQLQSLWEDKYETLS